jgi:hypothetical protein
VHYSAPSTSYSESFVQTSQHGDFHHVTPYSFSKVEMANVKGTRVSITNPGAEQTLITEAGPFLYSPYDAGYSSSDANVAYNQALADLSEKIRGNVDLSIDIIQAGQAKSMVSDALKLANRVRKQPVKALADAYKAYKNPTRATKALGSKWLEYQYGWKPLAQDLYDSGHRLLSGVHNLMVVSGQGKSKRRSTSTEPSPASYGNKTFKSSVHSYRHKVTVWCDTDSSTAQILSGYTSLNPASMAWESLPYSFVVDWFYDVGGYIRAQETAMLFNSGFRDGSSTATYLIQCDETCSSTEKFGSTVQTVGYNGWYKSSGLSRSRLSSFPTPRAPSFHADLGSGRLLNAAALLSQHFKR